MNGKIENAGSLRGCLTEELAEKYKPHMGTGYRMTTIELRLIPYLQYLAVNREPVDRRKISADEFAALAVWGQRGWIDFNIDEPVAVTKEFWSFMCGVLWDAYALHLIPPGPEERRCPSCS